MEFLTSLKIDSELIPQLLAILGLLVTWELHDIGVRSGRIKPRPIFDRSGRRNLMNNTEIDNSDSRAKRTPSRDVFDLSGVRSWIKSHAGVRMYIQATPNDEKVCPACREFAGKMFSAAALNHGKFKPLGRPCTNPAGCRCQLIGLIGNWPEAEQLWRSLDDSPQGFALGQQELQDLLKGATVAPRGTAHDRVNLYMLEALQAEGMNPVFAMSRYRSLIRYAVEGYDHPYLVPAYLRLSELLEQTGSLAAALTTVEDFIQQTKGKKFLQEPTQLQRKVMALRRTRLLNLLKTA
jgi:hypothetical protein